MIEMTQVTKRYEENEQTVFENLNLTIQEGELVLLTGMSGIGKSTLIRMLLKDTEVTEGQVKVFGQDITRMKDSEIPYYRRRLGVVFQDSYLIDDLTVFENIKIARIVTGNAKKSDRQVITSLMTLLGISHLHKQFPHQLSGGEKQRVGLARALVNYPELLLADEPTGNLSPQESKAMMKLFDLIHKQGTTVVIATHDKQSAEGIDYREIKLGGK